MVEQVTSGSRLLSAWPEYALVWARRAVWPRGFAIARTLVAIGTLVTLVATPTSTLFYRSLNFPEGVVCGDPATKAIALPCLMPGSQQGLMRLLMIVGLLFVLTGYLPRWSGHRALSRRAARRWRHTAAFLDSRGLGFGMHRADRLEKGGLGG